MNDYDSSATINFFDANVMSLFLTELQNGPDGESFIDAINRVEATSNVVVFRQVCSTAQYQKALFSDSSPVKEGRLFVVDRSFFRACPDEVYEWVPAGFRCDPLAMDWEVYPFQSIDI